MKSKLLLAILIVSFALGCTQTPKNESVIESPTTIAAPSITSLPEPALSFTPAQASCAGKKDYVGTTPYSNAIALDGGLSTPTPCYNLTATLESSGSNLTIKITQKQTTTGICVQCIGGIPFTARVTNLAAETYNLIVDYEGSIVLNETLDLSAGGLTADPCGDGVCDNSLGEFTWTCPKDCRK